MGRSHRNRLTFFCALQLRCRSARTFTVWLGLTMLAPGGCNLPPKAGLFVPASRPAPETPTSQPDSPFPNPGQSKDDNASRNPELRAARNWMVLGVLSVLIPESNSGAASKIWEHVREEMLDATTRLRLQDNGFRAGIGHVRLWEPVRAVLDGIEGHRVMQSVPLRVPAGFPLTFELDSEPRTQTLFYVGRDGTLRGSTYPSSRNAFRVTYAEDVRRADRIRMSVVPESQRKEEGWRWVRTQEGLWQVPRAENHPFEDVAFNVSLARDEFLLIAPSESASVRGILGRAMLTTDFEATSCFTYVFLRPEVPDVGQADASTER